METKTEEGEEEAAFLIYYIVVLGILSCSVGRPCFGLAAMFRAIISGPRSAIDSGPTKVDLDLRLALCSSWRMIKNNNDSCF